MHQLGSTPEVANAENLKGKLNLSIDLRLPQKNVSAKDITVTLKKSGVYDETQTMQGTGVEKEKQLFYTFDELLAGTYTLTIKGTGYQTVSQANVEIKPNTTSELHFTNGYDALGLVDSSKDPILGENEQNEEKHGRVGVVGIGDVNRDGNITLDDVKSVVNHIEGTTIQDPEHNIYDYTYDLNNDGVVDIGDISYAALNYGHSFVGASARFLTNIDTNQITTEQTKGSIYVDENGNSSGDIKDIFENNDKHVSLQPADTKLPISETNPIDISIDISDNTAETQFLNIAPSQAVENNITEGYITVDGVDTESGENVLVKYKIEKGIETSKVMTLYKVAEEGEVKSDSNISRILNDVPVDGGTAKIQSDGSIIVDFGSTIAVKRVIINVTGTTSNKLADISKVEFLNGMEDHIPEPDLNIPELRKADIDASITEEGFTVKWNNEPNVTGYRISITANLGNGDVTEYHDVEGHQLQIEQFQGDFIKNHLDKDPTSDDYTVYKIRICSLNGEWSSPYSESYSVKPRPTSKPNAPTGVKLKGGYQQIKVTWNKDPRATSYIVEYKPTNSDGEYQVPHKVEVKYNELTKVNEKIGIEGSSYTITGLSSGITEYSVRVIACNSLGESAPSQTATATTLAAQEVELPTYKRINKSTGNGNLSEHIKNITYKPGDKQRGMVDSPLDTVDGINVSGSAKGVADNNFGSYFTIRDWDWGGWYEGSDKGLKVEFDKPYLMNYITLAKVQWNGDFGYARVYYYDRNEGENKDKLVKVVASQVTTKQDKDGNKYTQIKLQKPIYTDVMTVSIGNASTGNDTITIAEMGFYEYDNIEQRINNLFKDSMHLELVDGVNEKTISDLENELNEGIDKEGSPGEKDYHPDKEALLSELETAKLILANANLGKVTKINSRVTSFYDSNVEFKNSLNGFQPLGVAARAGEDITIYIGNPYKNVGEPTSLQLIATQWRAEGDFQKVVIKNLQVGMNKVTIPEMISTSREKGGSLYINYTGLKDDDPYRYIDRNYAVRVSGGIEIPVLDLSSKENTENGTMIKMTEEERKAAVLQYVKEIYEVTNSMEAKHNGDVCKDYKGTDEYGLQDCLLGVTEIVLDDIMYSVSSKQIYDGLTEKLTAQDPNFANLDKDTSIQKRADALYDSLKAMEDMIELFYSQKGLVKEGVAQDTRTYGSNNTYPRTRQNIRCMRMTGRAFMYAGGLHIGIQWNEVKDLAKGIPMTIDKETGKETQDSKGNYFGWGIAHEIGHVINQQAYVHGEVTNNYFSILAQTDNTRNTVRFDYKDVYEKVTSGKIGKAQNVFTQLGLYWQLHLAYDLGGYNYKKYDSQKSQFENSIFARMDTYARNPSVAPKQQENGVELKIDSDSDNNLMRLACAATKKNLLEFFERWGMVPNLDTIKYAKQWDKETRAIWYVNDESRNAVLENEAKLPEGTKLEASITNANNNRVTSNKVEFSLNITAEDAKALLGYEIIRSYRSNNDIVSRSVAFVEPTIKDNSVTANVTYTDTIDTINNRAFTYTIVAYDKELNEIDRKQLDQVKVSHLGEISQKGWEITTNMESDDDKTAKAKDEDENVNNSVETSDFEQVISAAPAMADGDTKTVFNGKIGKDENGKVKDEKPEITISLPEVKKLVGLKYSGKKINYYEIQVSTDGKEWTTVKKVEKPNPVSRAIATVKNFFMNLMSTELNENENIIEFAQIIDGKETINNYDYDCSYVKIIIDDVDVSIEEIDLLSQSGDNVEFNTEGAIGTNASNFVYDKTSNYSIPEGSIIFTGTYKGNPAYNVIKLWYEDETTKQWKMLNGYSINFAPDPGKADLGETSSGKWIYVVEEKAMDSDGKYIEGQRNADFDLVKNAVTKGKVRIELYRVDNALTNEGERLVSDTLVTKVPDDLPSITLTSDYNKN